MSLIHVTLGYITHGINDSSQHQKLIILAENLILCYYGDKIHLKGMNRFGTQQVCEMSPQRQCVRAHRIKYLIFYPGIEHLLLSMLFHPGCPMRAVQWFDWNSGDIVIK